STAPDIGADEFAPSNAFTIGKLKGKLLTIQVASVGAVEVADAGGPGPKSAAVAAANRKLKRSSVSGGPGTIKVRPRLTKRSNVKLRRTGRLKVRARVTFTPTGGIANPRLTRLRFRMKK